MQRIPLVIAFIALRIVLATPGNAAQLAFPSSVWPTGIGPNDIVVDDEGTAFVLSGWHNRIEVYDVIRQLQYTFTAPGFLGLYQPSAIDLAPSGLLYVADTFNNRIHLFGKDGTWITSFSMASLPHPPPYWVAPSRPRGIAVSGNGNVYVSDYGNSRILVYSPDGKYVNHWGSQGTGPGQFDKPLGVAVDSDGSVYVADNLNHRIQKFTADGGFLTQWPCGSGNTIPWGIAVDGHGQVYCSVRNGDDHIEVFDRSGNPLRAFGRRGEGRGEFSDCMGLFVTPDGRIHVADSAKRRIQVFNAPTVAAVPATWSAIKSLIE